MRAELHNYRQEEIRNHSKEGNRNAGNRTAEPIHSYRQEEIRNHSKEGNRNAGNRTAEPQIHSHRREEIRNRSKEGNRDAGNRTAEPFQIIIVIVRRSPARRKSGTIPRRVIVMRVIVRRSPKFIPPGGNPEPFQGG